ncbi:hypothetical protein [Simkania sp.]|uniref:hypothetical protein n=1 Tax=Simkania sp. TaxID=34094 RepID=UPI003B527E37
MDYFKKKKQYGLVLLIAEQTPKHSFFGLDKAFLLASTGQSESARALIEDHQTNHQYPHSEIKYAKILRALGECGRALNTVIDLFLALGEETVLKSIYQKQIAEFVFQEKDLDRLRLILENIKEVYFVDDIYQLYTQLCIEQKKPDLLNDLILKYSLTYSQKDIVQLGLFETYLDLDELELAKGLLKELYLPKDRALLLLCRYYARKGLFEEARAIQPKVLDPLLSIRATVHIAEELHKKSSREGLKLAGEILDKVLNMPRDA